MQRNEDLRQEVEEIIRKLASGQQEIAEEGYQSYNRRVERVDKIARMLYLLVIIIIGSTTFLVGLNFRVGKLEESLRDHEIIKRVSEMWWIKQYGQPSK